MVERDARNLLVARNWRMMVRHRDGRKPWVEEFMIRARIEESEKEEALNISYIMLKFALD